MSRNLWKGKRAIKRGCVKSDRVKSFSAERQRSLQLEEFDQSSCNSGDRKLREQVDGCVFGLGMRSDSDLKPKLCMRKRLMVWKKLSVAVVSCEEKMCRVCGESVMCVGRRHECLWCFAVSMVCRCWSCCGIISRAVILCPVQSIDLCSHCRVL